MRLPCIFRCKLLATCTPYSAFSQLDVAPVVDPETVLTQPQVNIAANGQYRSLHFKYMPQHYAGRANVPCLDIHLRSLPGPHASTSALTDSSSPIVVMPD